MDDGDDRASGAQTDATCRLHALLARDGRSAVILRRGPSKRVQLIRWWLKTDTFEPGQWFKGRIYEYRCDLSPNGEKFVYFAQDYGRPLQSWTAISRPPYFSALALWAKGDCWGGGGLFESENTLSLNHPVGAHMRVHDGYRIPSDFRVQPLGDHSGGGEDDPINHSRMLRDGWESLQRGVTHYHARTPMLSYPCDPVRVFAQARPGTDVLTLLRITRGLGVQNGPWYLTDHAVVPSRVVCDVSGYLDVVSIKSNALWYREACPWADWDANGDLLYADHGRMLRQPMNGRKKITQTLSHPPKVLADFTDNVFTPLAPSAEALRW